MRAAQFVVAFSLMAAPFAAPLFGETTVLPESVTKAPPKAAPKRPPFVLTDSEKAAAISELRSKRLLLPLENADVESIAGSFYQSRGDRVHEAADFMAPHGTPIHAVEDGVVSRFFESAAGGLTIYQVDPTNQYVYYYAHLQSYAANLKAGDSVKRGQIIGFVGSSGNASPTAPHLHFSIGKMSNQKKVWDTASLDPYEVYKSNGKPSPLLRRPAAAPSPPQNSKGTTPRVPTTRSAIWI